MKKTWIIAVAVCAAVLFTACGKSAKNTESVANTVTESTAPSSESTGEASQEAPGNGAEFKILAGTVKKVGDNLEDMTVESGGKEMTFDLSGTVVETSYALEPEVQVSVIYKGEISGSDANCEGLDTDVLGTATDDSNGSGAMIKVTYVTVDYDAGSKTNFPLRVEAAK